MFLIGNPLGDSRSRLIDTLSEGVQVSELNILEMEAGLKNKVVSLNK